MDVTIRRRPASWAWRIPVLLAAALYVAGPLTAAVTAPTVPWWLTMALAALTALAIVVPRAAPAVLLAVVPLLPVLPTLVPGMPAGIVHLVLLTQAIPVLIRLALSRAPLGPVPFIAGWGIFLLVCAVSAGVELTPDRLRGAALHDVWRDLASQVPSYVFAAYETQDMRTVPLLIALSDGLLCALLVHASVTRATRPMVLAGAAAGALATALFGFVQARTGLGLQSAWMMFDPGIVRINSTFVDPNALAAYYALMGPIALALALGARGVARVLWGATFLAVSGAMVMTAGRTGLLSLALACVLLFWLGFRRRLDHVDSWPVVRQHARAAARRVSVAVLAALCLLVVAGTALNVSHAQQTSYLHTWLYTFNLRQPVDSVAKGRIAVWQTMAHMVRDAPLVGVGLGMGVNEFERYRRHLGVESLPANARLTAHNTFLLVAGDLGLLGLAAWLLMMLTVVHGIRAPGNLPANDLTTWPALGLVAGLGGLALTMLTGDRILLREDIVIGSTCAALACVGAGRLSPRFRLAIGILALLALVSWPVRVATRAADAPDLPPPRGFHGAPDDQQRWSSRYGVIFLPSDARLVTLPVWNQSPQPQRVRVYLDGRLAEELDLPQGTAQELTYRLPPQSRQRRWHRLTLEVEPTWQPPGDPRILGVVVGQWHVERRE